jgi:hypothetical protein
MCVANKIYLRGLPEALPASVAESVCGRNVSAECVCPESSRTNRAIIRGFASYWTDVSARISSRLNSISHEQRPFFRVTTGLIPSSVWRTHFGIDRSGLIGHKLDPNKLEAKIPRNLSSLDLHLVGRLHCLPLVFNRSDA